MKTTADKISGQQQRRRSSSQSEQQHQVISDGITDQVDVAAINITTSSNNGKFSRQNAAQNLLLNSSKTLLAQEDGLMNSDNSSGSGNDVANGKNSNNNMTYCLKQRWILILSMFVTFILAAILVAMLIANLSNKDDQCFNVRTAFPSTNYNLFSTKTTYSNAFDRLNNSALSASKGTPNPSLFSQSQSLAELNSRLSRDYDCKVRQFHYFGRHAARFPGQNKIEEIHKFLSDVQSRIDLSTSGGSDKQQKPPVAISNGGNNQSSSTDGISSEVCFNPLASYKNWNSFMRPDRGNFIMESGIEETRALAQRFKRIHPDLFDSQKTKIEVGVTREIRTAQTALVFMRLFENFNLDYCPLKVNVGSAAALMDADDSTDCSRLITDKYKNEKLEFHKKCESYHTEKLTISNLRFKDSTRTEFIVNSISKKLKLQLSSEETEALYDVCKYEVAYKGSSIWCNLFTEDELKFYEYLNDLDDFFNQAYGHPNQMKSACPVTTELIKAFKFARATSSSGNSQPQPQPEAHFYFTHSQVIQKILAASVDLESDPSYTRTKSVLQHLGSGDVPEEREWRTSLFTPFSANLAFTLYECPKFRRQSIGDESEILLDVGEQHPLKVVASLNERTIKLDGCSSHVCDITEILEDSRIGKEKRCKLEDVCRQEIIVY